MASYSSLVKEVLPYVPFCPDSLVESNLRSTTIEFCERSKAYVLDMDAFNTISGVYEYDFDIPTGTEVHQVLQMTYDGRDMTKPWAEQDITTVGYHYYMTPETAIEGIRKFPVAKDMQPKSWSWEDYPDLSKHTVFQ